MPPPLPAEPFCTVRFDIVTPADVVMENTRDAPLPSTNSFCTPGPLMVSGLSTTSSPVLRTIVRGVANDASNVTTPPAVAQVSAWRSEPAPASFTLLTTVEQTAAATNAALGTNTAAITAAATPERNRRPNMRITRAPETVFRTSTCIARDLRHRARMLNRAVEVIFVQTTDDG